MSNKDLFFEHRASDANKNESRRINDRIRFLEETELKKQVTTRRAELARLAELEMRRHQLNKARFYKRNHIYKSGTPKDYKAPVVKFTPGAKERLHPLFGGDAA